MRFYTSESDLKAVSAYCKMPDTDEKKEISRQYQADEISSYEFAAKAKAYLKKHNPTQTDKGGE